MNTKVLFLLRSVIIFIGLILLAGTSSRAEEKLVKFTDGVYGIKGKGAKVNTGIVVGSKGVFVLNCQLDFYKGRLASIQSVSGGIPIKFVGNGHAAGDDISCNAHFEDMGATILGSQAMYKHLLVKGPKKYKKRLEKEGSRLVYPHVTFKDRIVIDLGSHKVHMIYMGKGHTIGDTVVYLPKEKVLFSSDLLFADNNPTLREGDSVNWQRILQKLKSWEIEALVPGHGPIIKGAANVKQTIDALDGYFTDIRTQVKSMMGAGKGLKEIQKGIDLGKYKKWGRKKHIARNIKVIYTELGGKLM